MAQFVDTVDEAVAGQRFAGTVAPGDGEGVDATVRGGAHVGGGIADQQGLLRAAAGFCEDFPDDLRGRFQRQAGAVAEDGDEGDPGEEAADEAFGARLEFVGGDRQPDAVCVQLRQEFRDAGVRPRPLVDVGGISGLEIGQRRFHQRRVGILRERLRHQVADAVAHHAAVFVRRVRRQPARRQRLVHRRAEILQRVQQRPVEVEEDELFLE